MTYYKTNNDLFFDLKERFIDNDITVDKVDILISKAISSGLKINSQNVIIANTFTDGLRLTKNPLASNLWSKEVFKDSLLREFKITEVIPGVLVDIDYNLYSAFTYPSHSKIPLELERNNPYNLHNTMYQDNNRFVAGYKAPIKVFGFDFLMVEKNRIFKKRKSINQRSTKPEYYFKNPNVYDKELIDKFLRDNRGGYRREDLEKKGYFINLIGMNGIRMVKTKIEQWVWEEHIIKYSSSNYRPLLNELIFNDDGVSCKIVVPFGDANTIVDFVNRFADYSKDEVDSIYPMKDYRLSLDYNQYFEDYRKDILN